METLTDKIEIIALADFRNGRTIEEFQKKIDECAEKEEYEICAGIKKAIDKQPEMQSRSKQNSYYN